MRCTCISARWLVCLPCSRSATFLPESHDKRISLAGLLQRAVDDSVCVLVFLQWVVVAPVHADTGSGALLSVTRAAAIGVNDHSITWTESRECWTTLRLTFLQLNISLVKAATSPSYPCIQIHLSSLKMNFRTVWLVWGGTPPPGLSDISSCPGGCTPEALGLFWEVDPLLTSQLRLLKTNKHTSSHFKEDGPQDSALSSHQSDASECVEHEECFKKSTIWGKMVQAGWKQTHPSRAVMRSTQSWIRAKTTWGLTRHSTSHGRR